MLKKIAEFLIKRHIQKLRFDTKSVHPTNGDSYARGVGDLPRLIEIRYDKEKDLFRVTNEGGCYCYCSRSSFQEAMLAARTIYHNTLFEYLGLIKFIEVIDPRSH